VILEQSLEWKNQVWDIWLEIASGVFQNCRPEDKAFGRLGQKFRNGVICDEQLVQPPRHPMTRQDEELSVREE